MHRPASGPDDVSIDLSRTPPVPQSCLDVYCDHHRHYAARAAALASPSCFPATTSKKEGDSHIVLNAQFRGARAGVEAACVAVLLCGHFASCKRNFLPRSELSVCFVRTLGGPMRCLGLACLYFCPPSLSLEPGLGACGSWLSRPCRCQEF